MVSKSIEKKKGKVRKREEREREKKVERITWRERGRYRVLDLFDLKKIEWNRYHVLFSLKMWLKCSQSIPRKDCLPSSWYRFLTCSAVRICIEFSTGFCCTSSLHNSFKSSMSSLMTLTSFISSW